MKGLFKMIKSKFVKEVIILSLSALLLVLFQTLMINKAFANGLDESIASLQHAWAKAYYQSPDKEKEVIFEELSNKAHQVSLANPGQAEPLVWEAIILSSAAKFAGGLSGLSKAKESKRLLEAAEKIDPTTLNGSIYTSLGSLYYKVPGWPIGFGNKENARSYLEKAIKVNPDGIDANYFYADFLYQQGEYTKSRAYLDKAINAPARIGREDADQGRHAEIAQLSTEVNSKLK